MVLIPFLWYTGIPQLFPLNWWYLFTNGICLCSIILVVPLSDLVIPLSIYETLLTSIKWVPGSDIAEPYELLETPRLVSASVLDVTLSGPWLSSRRHFHVAKMLYQGIIASERFISAWWVEVLWDCIDLTSKNIKCSCIYTCRDIKSKLHETRQSDWKQIF